VLQDATLRFAGGSQVQPSDPMRTEVRRAARSLVTDPENAVGPSCWHRVSVACATAFGLAERPKRGEAVKETQA